MTAAIIGAAATILGAIVGALLTRTDLLDRITPSKTRRLVGKWDSFWVDEHDRTKKEHREDLYITKQKGAAVFGHIVSAAHPGKKWLVEGRFAHDLLQLLYSPASDAFIDFGCYFFQVEGDGNFVGYSVGFDYRSGTVGVSRHRLERVGA